MKFPRLRRQRVPWREDHTRNSDLFARKQELARESGGRYYGDGGTIHSSGELDVEVDCTGHVVAVWFRCHTLPFSVTWHGAGSPGPKQMRGMHLRGSIPELTGVEVRDKEPQ